MVGLFCKGLHCAGCGKGLPVSIIVLILGWIAITTPAFDNALGEAIIISTAIGAGAWIVSILIYVTLCRNLKVVSVRSVTNRLSYSQMKFLETGDTEWLALHGDIPAIENNHSVLRGEIVNGDALSHDPARLRR